MIATLWIGAFAAVGVAWWWAKWRAPEASALRVVERLSLGPRSGLAVVIVDSRRLLLAYGDAPPRLLPMPPLDPEEEAP